MRCLWLSGVVYVLLLFVAVVCCSFDCRVMCCLLFVVCCVLCVVCCVSFVALLCAVSCLLFVVGAALFVVVVRCCLWFVVVC